MEELALHILDLVTNSIEAGADRVIIGVDEDLVTDRLTITVEDNGRGMDKDLVRRVIDPFVTTRTTRKVGLGLPLLDAAARGSEGGMTIDSVKGRGTRVTAWFRRSHVDRAPLGDVARTVAVVVGGNPGVRVTYRHSVDGRSFELDTAELQDRLGDVPVGNPTVLTWIEGYLRESLREIGGARE
ncbi:MAG: ATP-binding protein [Firmicutes bacterium]|nr:ATP-binding protein [Bacillota bacterium]